MFDPNSEWRRVSSSIYRKPTDSKILGSVELDVTELEVYLKNQREKGIKLTYTHFFAFAIASGIKEKVPQFNTFVRRGKIVSRKTIDVAVSVLNHDATEMSAVVVKDFEKYKLTIDDQLKATDITFFNVVHERMLKRIEEAKEIYKEVLSELESHSDKGKSVSKVIEQTSVKN